MPSIATHYIFSQDVLLKVSTSSHIIPTIINKAHGAFMAGAQGPDIFFYDFVHLAVAKKKNNIGSHMHTSRTDTFFMNYVKEIFIQDCFDIPAVSAYIMGFLTHYSLDTALHPYVYSVTTVRDNSKKAASASLTAHCKLESDIDELIYYERFHTTINNANRNDFINITDDEIKSIAPVLCASINKTYGCKLSNAYIEGTFKRALFADNALQDNHGLKKKILEPVERKLTGANVCSSLIFDTTLPDRTCLNEGRKIWRDLATNKLYTSSFYELYEKAMKRAISLILKYNVCINNIYELCTVNNISMQDTPIDYINTKPVTTSIIFSNDELAVSQLANSFVKEFGKATHGLSYHTGISWRKH